MSRIETFAAMTEEARAACMSLAEKAAALSPAQRSALIGELSRDEKLLLLSDWEGEARPGQLAPEGGWRIWMIMAGRGFGKTRAGSEWVLKLARTPGLRIELVGPTED